MSTLTSTWADEPIGAEEEQQIFSGKSQIFSGKLVLLMTDLMYCLYISVVSLWCPKSVSALSVFSLVVHVVFNVCDVI